MTEIEAIKELECAVIDANAYEVCKKALEKQIAKKPKVKQLGEDIEVKCPTCSDYHMFINANRGNDYCSTCGQKLDWGNEDDRD